MMIAAHGTPDQLIRLELLKKVMNFLPPLSEKLLKALCLFLKEAANEKDNNKMDVNNVIIIFFFKFFSFLIILNNSLL